MDAALVAEQPGLLVEMGEGPVAAEALQAAGGVHPDIAVVVAQHRPDVVVQHPLRLAQAGHGVAAQPDQAVAFHGDQHFAGRDDPDVVDREPADQVLPGAGDEFSAAEHLHTPPGADQQAAFLQLGHVPDHRIVQPVAEPAEVPPVVVQQAAVGGEPGAAAAVADGVEDVDPGGEAAQPVAAVPFVDLAVAAAQQVGVLGQGDDGADRTVLQPAVDGEGADGAVPQLGDAVVAGQQDAAAGFQHVPDLGRRQSVLRAVHAEQVPGKLREAELAADEDIAFAVEQQFGGPVVDQAVGHVENDAGARLQVLVKNAVPARDPEVVSARRTGCR